MIRMIAAESRRGTYAEILALMAVLKPRFVYSDSTDLAAYGFPFLEPVARPSPSGDFEQVEALPDEEYEPGKWRMAWAVVPMPADQIIRTVSDLVQQRLDEFAQTRSYDNIHTAASYAGDSVPRFDADGTYCRSKRGETWQTLYTILGAVQAGQRAMPTSYAEIEAELPALEWPE